MPAPALPASTGHHAISPARDTAPFCRWENGGTGCLSTPGFRGGQKPDKNGPCSSTCRTWALPRGLVGCPVPWCPARSDTGPWPPQSLPVPLPGLCRCWPPPHAARPPFPSFLEPPGSSAASGWYSNTWQLVSRLFVLSIVRGPQKRTLRRGLEWKQLTGRPGGVRREGRSQRAPTLTGDATATGGAVWAGRELLQGPWSPAMQAREPAHCTEQALNKCSWLSKHTADGARGLSTRVGNNCPCLWPSGRWKASGAGEHGVPHGACPSPLAHPHLWPLLPTGAPGRYFWGARPEDRCLHDSSFHTQTPHALPAWGPQQGGIHTPRFSFAHPDERTGPPASSHTARGRQGPDPQQSATGMAREWPLRGSRPAPSAARPLSFPWPLCWGHPWSCPLGCGETWALAQPCPLLADGHDLIFPFWSWGWHPNQHEVSLPPGERKCLGQESAVWVPDTLLPNSSHRPHGAMEPLKSSWCNGEADAPGSEELLQEKEKH